MIREFSFIEVAIAGDFHAGDAMPAAQIDPVYEGNLRWFLAGLRADLDVKITLALKIGNKIAFSFLHQVLIERILFVDGDERRAVTVGESRAPVTRTTTVGPRVTCQCSARFAGFGIIGWRVQLDRIGEVVLPPQKVLQDLGRGLQALRIVRLSLLSIRSVQASTKRVQVQP